MPQDAVMTEPTPPSAAAGHSLGHRTARGFAWLVAQSVGDKLAVAAGQILLAWLLDPKDFTLVTLVYTVTTFASVFQAAGLREVLMARHNGFHLWANAVFWMSLTIGLVAMGLTAGVAPLASNYYGRPELVGLILVASTLLPISALGTVPEARLRSRMQFRFLAAVTMVTTLVTQVLSVTFAAAGLHAYSFVLPAPIAGLVRAGLFWWWAKPEIRWRPQVRRWKYLVSASTQLLIASLCLMVTFQGSSIILGRLYPKPLIEAGLFYFAWNLSDQSLRLLVNNLSGVLFPAFSTMDGDRSRQMDAFLRATRLLLLVGLPVCLVQAALSGPVIRLVFPPKWEPAIPIMAALSVGMTARLVMGPCESLFLAQKRYLGYMIACMTYAVFFIAVVYAASNWKGATGAGIGSGGLMLVMAPALLALAARSRGVWSALRRVYGLPLLVTALGVGPAAGVPWFMPRTLWGDLASCAIVGGFVALAYPLLVRRLARRDWDELVGRAMGLLKRGRRAQSESVAKP